MHLPAHRGATKAERLFILLLVLSFIGFSVWLKMLPNLGMNLRPNAPPIVKLWMDPSHDSDSQVKLVWLDLALLMLVAPALVPRMVWSIKSVQVPISVARDIFSESRHWFRPPPLF